MAIQVDGNAVDWFVDRHLRDATGGIAFEDPWRSLTREALAAATRRFAGALTAHGIERERRLVMLMLDTVDFPVVFWGALRAGVLPVPINTLLTPDLARYVLEDSRAEAIAISEPLLAGFGSVLGDLPSLRKIIVVKPDGTAPAATDDPRAVAFADFVAAGDPDTPAIATSPDEVAFWLYSSGSTGAPKGVRHVHASLRATADTYRVAGAENPAHDVVFSAAKAFHAYGLGNSMTFPMAVGATAVLLPDRPTPDAVLDTMRRCQPDDLRRRADALRIVAVEPVDRAERRLHPVTALHLRRRGAAGRHRRPLETRRRRGHSGRHRLHRDAAHIHQQPGRGRAVRHQRQAGARLRRDGGG